MRKQHFVEDEADLVGIFKEISSPFEGRIIIIQEADCRLKTEFGVRPDGRIHTVNEYKSCPQIEKRGDRCYDLR